MIALSAGHYPASPGACHGDYCEHAEAAAWVSIVANLLRGQVPPVIVPTGRLTEKVTWLNRQAGVKLACEIHFNSDASKRQAGSETLYCPGSARGATAAAIVQAGLGGVFPPSRGAKEGWYRMDKPGHVDYPGDIDGDEKKDYFLEKTNMVALIVEPEFIYNWKTIEDRRHAGCSALAAGLLRAYEGL